MSTQDSWAGLGRPVLEKDPDPDEATSSLDSGLDLGTVVARKPTRDYIQQIKRQSEIS